MSRGPKKGDSKRYYDWIYHASLDMMAAQILCNEPKLYYTAAFHCKHIFRHGIAFFLQFLRAAAVIVISSINYIPCTQYSAIAHRCR